MPKLSNNELLRELRDIRASVNDIQVEDHDRWGYGYLEKGAAVERLDYLINAVEKSNEPAF